MSTSFLQRGSPRFASRSRGLSLIEVLVAVLVLGLGLLGLAMLQATNLRLAQSSNQRTIATNLANDLFDDIRSNRLLAAKYTGIYDAKDVPANANCARIAINLMPAQRIEDFRCKMKSALGSSAKADVKVEARNISIRITWDDSKRWSEDPTAPGGSFEMRSSL